MKYAYIKREVKVPSNVTLKLDDKKVAVKGPKGEITRDFSHAKNVEMSMQDDTIVIEAKFPRKEQMALVGTLEGHIKNMILGVTQGFKYKMVIGYSHFPVTVKVNPDNNVEIQNFQGERGPRKVETSPNVKITSTKENVIIEGIDKEEVSMVAARLQQASRVHRKDHRIFQDGLFVFEKWAGDNLIWHIKM
ncbi:MAG TPA: 50S ribosomal protein L6 [Candidatus Lokiarchaeia archaeon]|nr:50S ribosomal protein L6 [Candidatus Lokiarchaeia archaeon]